MELGFFLEPPKALCEDLLCLLLRQRPRPIRRIDWLFLLKRAADRIEDHVVHVSFRLLIRETHVDLLFEG